MSIGILLVCTGLKREAYQSKEKEANGREKTDTMEGKWSHKPWPDKIRGALIRIIWDDDASV